VSSRRDKLSQWGKRDCKADAQTVVLRGRPLTIVAYRVGRVQGATITK
jgi:hypothetical protein